MKQTTENTETRVFQIEETPAEKNQFQDRAMTLIEEQLPVAIAIGREAATYNLLRTLHLIAGGTPGYDNPNTSLACEGSGRVKY